MNRLFATELSMMETRRALNGRGYWCTLRWYFHPITMLKLFRSPRKSDNFTVFSIPMRHLTGNTLTTLLLDRKLSHITLLTQCEDGSQNCSSSIKTPPAEGKELIMNATEAETVAQ